MSAAPARAAKSSQPRALELVSETIIHPLVFSLWVQGGNTEVNDVCFSSTFFSSSRNEKITSRLTH